jgi:hypothetical protein
MIRWIPQNGLKTASFWKQSTQEKSDAAGMDGAQWIIEGVKNGHYHIVDRGSPSNAKYRDAALFLVKLGDLQIKDIY